MKGGRFKTCLGVLFLAFPLFTVWTVLGFRYFLLIAEFLLSVFLGWSFARSKLNSEAAKVFSMVWHAFLALTGALFVSGCAVYGLGFVIPQLYTILSLSIPGLLLGCMASRTNASNILRALRYYKALIGGVAFSFFIILINHDTGTWPLATVSMICVLCGGYLLFSGIESSRRMGMKERAFQ